MSLQDLDVPTVPSRLGAAMVDIGSAALDDRIVAAFSDAGGITAASVADLITEVEQAAVEAQQISEQARATALDPLTSSSSERAARDRMSDCAFRFDRLMAARSRLDQRRRELEVLEEDDRRAAAYARAVTERDRVAKELAEYPAIVAKLSKLFAALAASNREVAAVNAQLPDGASWVELAERQAKGMAGEPLDRRDQSVLEAKLPPWIWDSPVRWPRDLRFG
jgi:hypothetical protein